MAPEQADPLEADWLMDSGSLTLRLSTLANGYFAVTPLLEASQPLRDEECTALGLRRGSEGWVREVWLRGYGTPWVFARSVASLDTTLDAGLALDRLGTQSLGQQLFSDRAFVRGPIETCRYPVAWLPAEQRHAHLWARRSRFDRGPCRVLVAEVFLPELWRAARLEGSL